MVGPVLSDERWDRLIAEHRSARDLVDAAEARRASLSELSRYLYGLFGGCAGVLGASLLAISMTTLRSAYLYRERTGEGLGYVATILHAVPGALLCLVAIGCLLNASRGASRTAAILLRASAGLLGVAIVSSWAVASWVEGQTGCIGPCG